MGGVQGLLFRNQGRRVFWEDREQENSDLAWSRNVNVIRNKPGRTQQDMIDLSIGKDKVRKGAGSEVKSQ